MFHTYKPHGKGLRVPTKDPTNSGNLRKTPEAKDDIVLAKSFCNKQDSEPERAVTLTSTLQLLLPLGTPYTSTGQTYNETKWNFHGRSCDMSSSELATLLKQVNPSKSQLLLDYYSQ